MGSHHNHTLNQDLEYDIEWKTQVDNTARQLSHATVNNSNLLKLARGKELPEHIAALPNRKELGIDNIPNKALKTVTTN